MPYPSSPNFYPSAAGAYPGYSVAVVDPTPTPDVPPPDASAPPPPQPLTPPQLPEWSFVLGPAQGGQVRDLADARSRKCSFKLTDPSEVTCELDGLSDDAAYLQELSTDLHVFRAPGPGQRKQRLYRGRVGKSGDTFDEDKHTVSVPSLDYRAVLKRRRFMSGSTITWTQLDQAAIAQALIDQAQRLPGGSYGIGLGRLQGTGVVKDYAVQLGDAVGDKLQELSEVDNGFDWDITPTSPSAMQLDIWYPGRGEDRGVILELGGAVVSGSRDVDSSNYGNHIRMTGQAPDGGGAGPAIQERTAADIATRPEGRWDLVIGTDRTTDSTLIDRIEWQLGESQTIRPSYTLTLRPGFWRGPDHIWLGDTVTVRIYSGKRLKVNAQYRIQQLDVTISDEGDELVSVTAGAPKPDYRKRAADLERRLSSLERR